MRAAAANTTPNTTPAKKRVIALDFDGVVCDSVGESSLSAFRAAQQQWPEVFNTPAAEAARPRLVEQMRAVRPVVETGYENVVQIRLLLEGTTVDEMLASWHELLPAAMARWRLEREPLVRLFGRVRDEWIAADAAGWLAPNRIYDGVAPAVAAALASAPRDEVYVVTTKQAQFTELLLRDMARLPLPAERIYSTTLSGAPKSGVLAQLAAAHPGADDYVFVEDKLSTLEKVAATPGAEAWRLFLVDWGYNTPAERARAAAHSRITVLDVGAFGALMRGCDD
jgi:phosphoglycolate phosphatase-like HAD superfamily hydrolase